MNVLIWSILEAMQYISCILNSDAGTGGPGGPLALQYLADQLTLFQPWEGRLSPPINYYWPPQCFSPSGITGIYWNIMFAFDRSTRAAEFRQAGEAYALIMVALPIVETTSRASIVH